ncbi:MAG: hypothetical protein E7490_06945 [Ruminococcaceae bacterium]|nr:hypothetical protein [Oscillospiraceae bacterium]
MGFFDSLLKSAARTATRRAVNKAVDAGFKKATEALSDNDKDKKTTTKAAAAKQDIKVIDLVRPTDVNGTETEFELYLKGNNVKCSFVLADGFKEYNAGAMEISYSALYSPFMPIDTDMTIDDSIPKIYIGDADRPIEKIIDKYEDNGEVENGNELFKINSGMFSYKMYWKYGNSDSRYASYCVKFPGAPSYTQFTVVYPVSMVGTDKEKLVLSQLDLAAATFVVKS